MHAERRSPCVLKWRITCRRPVIADVIPLCQLMRFRLIHVLLLTALVAVGAALYAEKSARTADKVEIKRLRGLLGIGSGDPNYFHCGLGGSRFSATPSAWIIFVETFDDHYVTATVFSPNSKPTDFRIDLTGVRTVMVREYVNGSHFFSTGAPTKDGMIEIESGNSEFIMTDIRYGMRPRETFLEILMGDETAITNAKNTLNLDLSTLETQKICDKNNVFCVTFQIMPLEPK